MRLLPIALAGLVAASVCALTPTASAGDDRSVSPTVRQRLNDPDPAARANAVRVLGQQSDLPDRVLEILNELLEDGDDDVRKSAAQALVHQGETALPYLEQALASDQPTLRRLVAAGFSDLPPRLFSKGLVALLLDTLASTDPVVRESARRTLAQAPEVAGPLLQDLAAEREVELPDDAWWIVAESDPKSAIPFLIRSLIEGGEHGYDRPVIASHFLADLGPPALPALIQLLRDAQATYGARSLALDVVGRILRFHDVAEPPLDDLIAVARGREAELAETALEILGRLGPRGEAAQTAIILGHAPRPPWPTEQTSFAQLVEALKNEDWQIRAQAVDILAEAEAPAGVVLPLIRDALKDREFAVRKRARYALVQKGYAGLPYLLEALTSTHVHARRMAARAFTRHPQVESVTADLTMALADSDSHVRLHAAEALHGTEDDDAARALLLTSDQDPSPEVREAAFSSALAAIRASFCTSFLLELLKSDSRALTEAAMETLAYIGEPCAEPLKRLILDETADGALRLGALHTVRRMRNVKVLSPADLLQVARSTDDELSVWAPVLLNELDDESLPQSQLEELARSASPEVRIWAASRLHGRDPENPFAEPILMACLLHQDPAVRMHCLNHLSLETPRYLSTLVAALKDSCVNIRTMAAWALGRLGAQAQNALPALWDLAAKENDEASATAADAWEAIIAALKAQAGGGADPND